MGLVDKIKSLFKKKKEGESATEPTVKKSKGSAAKRAASFTGDGKVADALRFAADRIDDKVVAGMSEKRADVFMDSLKAVEASDASEDVKLLDISQIIGGITSEEIVKK